jgi:hypothetical protein
MDETELQRTPAEIASKARRKSRKQKQEREAYAAMLRAVTAENLAKTPQMISIPSSVLKKSSPLPADKENWVG